MNKICKENLVRLYLEDQLSIKKISVILNCSYGTIYKYLTEYNIPRRKSGFRKGDKFSEIHKKNLSKSMKGRNIGKSPRHGKRFWYKCPNGSIVSMRSRWEVAFASFLDCQNKIWMYEPKTFILSNGAGYTPDFYLTDENRFFEIKGWFTEEHKKRISLFKKDHPNIVLDILQKEELEELGIDLNKEHPGAKLPYLKCEQCGASFFRKNKKQKFCGNICKNKWIANHKTTSKNSFEKPKKRKYNKNQEGSNNNSAKLKESDVVEIINLRNNGKTLKEIAKTKNTSIGNIGNILKGRSWNHINKGK